MGIIVYSLLWVGNYGIFLIMSNARFISSAVSVNGVFQAAQV